MPGLCNDGYTDLCTLCLTSIGTDDTVGTPICVIKSEVGRHAIASGFRPILREVCRFRRTAAVTVSAFRRRPKPNKRWEQPFDVRRLQPEGIATRCAILIGASADAQRQHGAAPEPRPLHAAADPRHRHHVSDFTLAIAVQNLAWGFLQPVAGALTARYGFRPVMLPARCFISRASSLLRRRHGLSAS